MLTASLTFEKWIQSWKEPPGEKPGRSNLTRLPFLALGFEARSVRLLWAAALLLCGARSGFTADEAPDVGETVRRAEEEWSKGDRLAERIRKAVQDGGVSGDPIKLSEEQERAYEEAEALFLSAIKAAPGNPRARARYGGFLAARRQYGKARDSLEAAVGLPPPEGLQFTKEERAEALRLLGGALERAGQHLAALARYDEAARLNPGDPRLRISLAVAHAAFGQSEPAMDLLAPWAQNPPPELTPLQRTLVNYTLAYARETAGDLDGARQDYARALQTTKVQGFLDPGDLAQQAEQALWRVEDLLEELDEPPPPDQAGGKKDSAPGRPRDRLKTALGLVEKALQLKRAALADRKALESALKVYASAKTEEERRTAREREPLRSFFSALRHLEVAMESWPRLGRVYRELGCGYFMLGQLQEARKYLDSAAAFDPLSVTILCAQGQALLIAKDWEAAGAVFAKLLRLDPEYGPGQLGLARAALMMRRREQDVETGLIALDHAERLGIPREAIRPLRLEAATLLEKVRRGEPLSPPRRTPPASQPLEPWRLSPLLGGP
jgi:tetratricopeptide (TPR) repeat protein